MITIRKGGIELAHEMLLFPGGEVGVKLDRYNYAYLASADIPIITARIQSSNDLMELVMVADALRRMDDRPIKLFMPYIPYARQDRVCDRGESLSLKAFANIINGIGFLNVLSCDPHSDVSYAVFNNFAAFDQQYLISKHEAFNSRVLLARAGLFVSPDAGAEKKTIKIANYFGHNNFIRSAKIRDVTNGEIMGTEVHWDDFGFNDVFICDDICDGGKTFIELAKILKKKRAGKIILYVTHGIFSKGTSLLFKNGIDEIFSTDSYCKVWPGGVDHVTTLKLEETLKL